VKGEKPRVMVVHVVDDQADLEQDHAQAEEIGREDVILEIALPPPQLTYAEKQRQAGREEDEGGRYEFDAEYVHDAITA